MGPNGQPAQQGVVETIVARARARIRDIEIQQQNYVDMGEEKAVLQAIVDAATAPKHAPAPIAPIKPKSAA